MIYKVIYSFHMPAFMFITGFFAKFRIKKIILNLVISYVVLQIIYLLFDRYILGGNTSIQFIKPYWLLWYLVAVTYCVLLVPLFERCNEAAAWICILVLTACSLLAGFAPIGYGFSLSRFVVFLPFFACGFFARRFKLMEKLHTSKGRAVSGVLSVAGIVAGMGYIFIKPLPVKLLYGSYSHKAVDCAVYDRAVVLLTAFCCILLLLLAIPNIKIPVVTKMGMDTFVPYIFHGFAVKLAGKYRLFQFSEGTNLVLAAVFSFVMYIGLSFAAGAVKKIFRRTGVNENGQKKDNLAN